ncbi:hypothetical protein RHO12_12640 (plasmid) [Orbus sturtevantii]|uniref:hypothetical protein n=1 Tax=Orbus sturtevantii TaxID=3074109 RepID=UPI00370D8EEA
MGNINKIKVDDESSLLAKKTYSSLTFFCQFARVLFALTIMFLSFFLYAFGTYKTEIVNIIAILILFILGVNFFNNYMLMKIKQFENMNKLLNKIE